MIYYYIQNKASTSPENNYYYCFFYYCPRLTSPTSTTAASPCRTWATSNTAARRTSPTGTNAASPDVYHPQASRQGTRAALNVKTPPLHAHVVLSNTQLVAYGPWSL